MEVITLDSEIIRKLLGKIESVEGAIKDIAGTISSPLQQKWYDNEEVCRTLKISKRLLQSYRDEYKLPFSQINHKIYYKSSDLEKFLEKYYRKIQGF
jgi:hypothetical protein